MISEIDAFPLSEVVRVCGFFPFSALSLSLLFYCLPCAVFSEWLISDPTHLSRSDYLLLKTQGSSPAAVSSSAFEWNYQSLYLRHPASWIVRRSSEYWNPGLLARFMESDPARSLSASVIKSLVTLHYHRLFKIEKRATSSKDKPSRPEFINPEKQLNWISAHSFFQL